MVREGDYMRFLNHTDSRRLLVHNQQVINL